MSFIVKPYKGANTLAIRVKMWIAYFSRHAYIWHDFSVPEPQTAFYRVLKCITDLFIPRVVSGHGKYENIWDSDSFNSGFYLDHG